jgi:putative phosphoserine phosphatase/1-acylglycerol-3-phosphate O-acyltransferase
MRTRSTARTSVLAVRLIASGLLITVTSVIVLLLAVVSLFQARRLYAAATTRLARTLLRVWSIRVRVHPNAPFPRTQVVYISNHTSTLDLFVLVALGLPRTRFFLSGFLQRYLPLAILARLMGTFFTVPQRRQAERRRIFAAACRTLRATGESVYLSPEGARVITGEIGAFNKGAFHLATALGAPIVPLYFAIPRNVDPGLGYDAGAGVVDVYVKPPIETRDWRVEDVVAHKEAIRDLYVIWHAIAS